LAIMLYRRSLAVHEPSRPDYLAAEHLHDGLVPDAHAEHRHLAGEGADHVHGDAGIVGRTRPGRDAQVRGIAGLRLFHRDRVVAPHVDFGAEHQEGLHQVVGEGIVVVDQQQADASAHRPSAASLRARAMAPDFATTSSYSVAGTLSATMPAPAW